MPVGDGGYREGMSTLEPSTSLQRTYRYLRIGIAGMVVVIFASVGVAAASVGWLTSLSDYYYTSARTPFVGALIAVGFALLALAPANPTYVRDILPGVSVQGFGMSMLVSPLTGTVLAAAPSPDRGR